MTPDSDPDPSEIIAMYNTYPYHSAPLAINLASNVYLKYLDPDATRAIRLTSDPFGKCEDEEEDVARYRQGRSSSRSRKRNSVVYVGGMMSNFLPLALLIVVTCFIVVPIEERLCQAKQLQTMSGASPLLYWGSFFTFDYLILYFLLIFLMFVYMLIFDWYRVYTYDAGSVVFLIIVLMYGFAGILFSYVFSLRAGSVAGGFILVMLIHVVTGTSNFHNACNF